MSTIERTLAFIKVRVDMLDPLLLPLADMAKGSGHGSAERVDAVPRRRTRSLVLLDSQAALLTCAAR